MGQIQSLACRTLSSLQTVGELSDPVLSAHDIFQALTTLDADSFSDLLDESQFDLTTHDESSGQTILHLSIQLCRHDITEILLQRAQHDPAVLNTPDHHGYTPLVFAAEKGRVELMQAILGAGGHTGDSFTLADLKVGSPRSIKDGWVCMALMLIEAQGDVSTAFELAVQHRHTEAAKAYFYAGACILSALQRGPDAIRWMTAVRCLRADDVLSALQAAKQVDDVQSIMELTRTETVLLALDNVADRSDAKIAELLKAFIDAGANAEDLVEVSMGRCLKHGLHGGLPDMRTFLRDIGIGSDDFGVIKQLFNVGASGVPELIWQAEYKRAYGIDLMISLGADALGALKKLPCSSRHLVARSALIHTLGQRELSEADRVEKLKALMEAGGELEAEKLLRNLISKNGSFENVTLLMRAGVFPSEDLLMMLVSAACYAELRHIYANKPGHSPQRQLLRELIRMDADFSPVVTTLRRNWEMKKQLITEHCRVVNLPEAAKIELLRQNSKQDELRLIMYAMLQELLSKASLSSAEKIAQLKSTLSDGAGPAAAELLRDAVNASHWATVKLLVLADTPSTDAYVDLSRRLVKWEENAHTSAQRLISMGADYRPAMKVLLENINAHTKAKGGKLEVAANEQEALHALGRVIAQALAPRGPGNPHGTIAPEP